MLKSVNHGCVPALSSAWKSCAARPVACREPRAYADHLKAADCRGAAFPFDLSLSANNHAFWASREMARAHIAAAPSPARCHDLDRACRSLRAMRAYGMRGQPLRGCGWTFESLG